VCWRGRAPRLPPGQEPKTLVEPLRNLFCTERFDPCRRQLERKRDAVEASAVQKWNWVVKLTDEQHHGLRSLVRKA